MVVVLWQQVVQRVCAATVHSFTGLLRDSDFIQLGTLLSLILNTWFILNFVWCNMTAKHTGGIADFYNQLRWYYSRKKRHLAQSEATNENFRIKTRSAWIYRVTKSSLEFVGMARKAWCFNAHQILVQSPVFYNWLLKMHYFFGVYSIFLSSFLILFFLLFTHHALFEDRCYHFGQPRKSW